METLKEACSLGRPRVEGTLRASPLLPRGKRRSVWVGSSASGPLVENSRIQRISSESNRLQRVRRGVGFEKGGGAGVRPPRR